MTSSGSASCARDCGGIETCEGCGSEKFAYVGVEVSRRYGEAVELGGAGRNTSDDTSESKEEGSWLFTKFAPTGCTKCSVGNATTDLRIGVEKATVTSEADNKTD
ncbi:hypothetical protein M8C21_006003 [Ambrosia artemisiifolia]|uniref:Uncharacterized protein n=1 Tax=Ambrosia artemisiifolia TaxID=4212 RepID=A0AAD5BYQ7_AMBAR|nr:hypothetical protein M8C21_006003 [Ambrosia artemisiifolia]